MMQERRGIGAPIARVARWRSGVATLAVTAVVCLTNLLSANGAGAAVQSFSVAPTSGSPGTIVNVSGTACSPGLTVSASQDYVKITSTTLPLSTNIPVAANGSWNGTFTVPSNAPALPAVIAAVCFTNSLPSLTTIYIPQTFTVTAAPVATTTPKTAHSTTTTPVVTTPTTTGNAPSTHPSKGTVPPNDGSNPPDDNGQPGNDPSSGGGDGSSGGGTTIDAPRGSDGGASGDDSDSGAAPSSGAIDVARRANSSEATSAALEASLRDPDLASNRSSSDNGLPWMLWLIVIALLVGAGAALWWWRRYPEKASPSDSVTDGAH